VPSEQPPCHVKVSKYVRDSNEQFHFFKHPSLCDVPTSAAAGAPPKRAAEAMLSFFRRRAHAHATREVAVLSWGAPPPF
jgi:hypothetical protein